MTLPFNLLAASSVLLTFFSFPNFFPAFAFVSLLFFSNVSIFIICFSCLPQKYNIYLK